MKNNMSQRAARFYQNRRRKQLWYRIVSGMACVVVFCTVYALILPAITLEEEPHCGLEEHIHTEDCYTQETVWPTREYRCAEELADSVTVHTHDDMCYDRNGDLVCPLPEIEEHTHSADCWRETEVLTCGLEETGHIHDSACYTRVRGELSCGLEECVGHTHGSDCYEAEQTLVCGLGEDGEHTHGGDCYASEEVLTCALEESEGHTHSDACYDWAAELSCGREEDLEGHLHSADCYTAVTELVCGEEEIILHTHEESCYDTEDCPLCEEEDAPEHTHPLICGKPQVLEHRHDGSCAVELEGEAQEVRMLTCGMQEHTHTDACYEEEATLNSGAGEQAYVCGLEEHTHDESCYDEAGALACALAEHVHGEACLSVQPGDSAFPEELPEGYTEYTFDGEDGLSVVAYAPENAFGGQTVTLQAEKLSEDSQGYTEAQANLEAAEDVEYDGFVALDIRFEDRDGAEVEPDAAEGRVYVKLDALALLPDDADQTSVAVQHHCPEGEVAIVAAPVVQTVADGSEETGTVEVTATAQTLELEDGEIDPSAALDVTAAFSVESFSTFTVTWKDYPGVVLTVHYVDELGIEIADSYFQKIEDPERSGHDGKRADIYAKNLVSKNYFFQGAYTSPVGGREVVVVTYAAWNSTNEQDMGFRYSYYDGNGQYRWDFLGEEGQPGYYQNTKADVYLRYRYVASTDDTPRTVETTRTEHGGEGGQVVESGGTNTSKESDEVAVSKTLAPTGIENVFDITLKVQTKTKVEEVEKVQPLDVVIVMDVSNTMSYRFGGSSTATDTDETMSNNRYSAAMEAATNFINQFQQNSQGLTSDRRIGFVMFNTSSHVVFELSECKTTSQASSLIDTMKQRTSDVFYRTNGKIAEGYGVSHDRFTNMESGINEAQKLLSASESVNKYIIFLTDGFPTTWGLGSNAQDPYYNSNFRNRRLDLPCTYGTSYSDAAAHYAENHAQTAKSNGIKIFAIGVDVGGQSTQDYEKLDSDRSFSVIDCFAPTDSRLVGRDKYMIGQTAESFKNWLQTYISSGVGYYFSSDSKEDLSNAFNWLIVKSSWTLE